MGKHAGASPEELEFIFGCFLRGLSDGEVLEEMQDTEYPRRNPRFIRDRRRHFDAARKVLEQHGLLTHPVINWIEDYQAKHGELPLIPDFMAPLVKDYSPGQIVSKEMKLGHSPPYWDNLLPSQRKKVLELVRWLGQDPDDYEELIKRLIPGHPSDIRVTWKR